MSGNRFVAGNGAHIEVHEARIDIKCTGSSDEQHFLSVKETEAAREYFQHERDEELGRWRWPEKPEWVVYSKRPGFSAYNGADLLVINESHGSSMEYSRALDDGTEYVDADEKAALAARAYFEAHPERKPWEEANNEDIWVLTVGKNETVYQFDSTNRFFDQVGSNFTKGISANSDGIVSGRRIWPEDAS